MTLVITGDIEQAHEGAIFKCLLHSTCYSYDSKKMTGRMYTSMIKSFPKPKRSQVQTQALF